MRLVVSRRPHDVEANDITSSSIDSRTAEQNLPNRKELAERRRYPERPAPKKPSRGEMGGRAKAKGRGGGRGGGGRGRGRSAHGSGGRFGWGGGAGPSSSRGGGIYGPDDGGDYVALKGASPGGFFPGYGGGPKRKHRQMHQAYAYAGAGGRRVRRQDSDDSETTSEEEVADGGALDHDHDEDEDEDDDDDESDPNIERNSVMRIGGIEIRMDRPGARGRGAREPFPPRREAPSDDEDDDDDEDDPEGEWGSELSLDSDAIDDYVRNCMDGSDDDDDDDDDTFDEDAAADAAVAAAEDTWERSEREGYGGKSGDAAARAARRAAREDRYLRRMRDMNLDGAEVPSPPVSDSGLGSDDLDDSEAENEALKGGDYGAYLWGTGSAGKKKGASYHADGGFPSSGKRAAKKAAKKAARQGREESAERDAGLRRPRAVAETLAGMIRSGGAYIGFQAGMSPDALRGLLGIAHAMGLEAEVRGGGKRRHVVVHWTPRARVPRDGDERLERAIASAEGQPYDGGGGGGRGDVSGRNGTSSAPSFVSAGVMRNDDDDGGGMDVSVGDVDDEAKPEAETDFPIEGEAAGSGAGLTPEVEAELAAADADAREAEAFLTAAAGGGAEGDGVEDDGEEVRRGNRGLRRAALAAERELRASLAQRKKKGDGRVVGAGHSFGAFEAHTSGFGSRMLAKMGFQGEGAGAGKDGRGISEPIAASIRGKRVGLGAERK